MKIKNLTKRIFNILIKNYIRTFSILLRENYFARKVNKINNKFDIVISHDNFALLAGYFSARKNDAHFIYDAVEIPEVRERTGSYFRTLPWTVCIILRWRYRRLVSQAHRVLTVSPALKDWLEKHFERDDVSLIENARKNFVVEKNSTIRHDLDLQENEKLILCINSLVPGMGVEKLLEEFSIMPSNMHLANIGAIDEGYMRSLKRKYDNGRLHFLGPKPYEELPHYMSGADVGVITLPQVSLNMKLALPNRFFDYVAAKLPIVTTSLPSVNDYLLKYGNGVVVNNSFTVAIVKILDNPKHYLKACDRAANELLWNGQEERLLSLLSGHGKKVALLANKPIETNGRISRMVDSLIDSGFDVTVIANSFHSTPNPLCSYIVLEGFQEYVKSFFWR